MLSLADLPELPPAPLLVKEKAPTFVRIPGISGASRVTCTARGPGHHASVLAEAAAGFMLAKGFKLRSVNRRETQRSYADAVKDSGCVPFLQYIINSARY